MADSREDKALLATPRVAWTTLVLFVVTLAAWGASIAGLALGRIPLALAMAVATAAAFVVFTPMHDASHRSVTRSRVVNEIVGRLAGVPLGAVFPLFRYLHLEHHKYTNEPERDPDLWVALPPAWLRPLRWMTMEWPYLAHARRSTRALGRAERVEMWLWLAFYASAVAVALHFGLGRALVLGWLVPAKLATVLLAYAFDYLPHRPHTISSRHDRYRATIVQSDPWRTPILLYQNYHLVHHLYPAVPFYRYARIWRAQRELLLANGAVDRAHSPG